MLKNPRRRISFFANFLFLKIPHLVVFLCAAMVFGVFFMCRKYGDVIMHVGFVREFLAGEIVPGNFLYYLTIILVGFFQNNNKILMLASLLVLSFAVALKFHLTKVFFWKKLNLNSNDERARKITVICAFLLLLTFNIYLPPIPGINNHFFIGQIPPNVWHNSTTIFLAPFAMLLFWYSARSLESPRANDVWLLSGLVALNILSKPSFFFCFVAVFPILALFRFRLKKEFWLSLVPVGIGCLLVFLQYLVIYRFDSFNIHSDEEKSGIAVTPFLVWKMYSANIPISILVSTAFPLAYLVFYPRRVISQLLLYYAYCLFLVALVIMVFVSESGGRQSHGNFFWQAFVCNYLLFFVVLADFVQNLLRNKKLNWKDKITAVLFALHVVSGVLYLLKVPFYDFM